MKIIDINTMIRRCGDDHVKVDFGYCYVTLDTKSLEYSDGTFTSKTSEICGITRQAKRVVEWWLQSHC